MDWTDTLLFESHSPGCDVAPRECVQVFPAHGVTLLQAGAGSHELTETALNSLRGFRAVGRRIVLCDTSGMSEDFRAVERQLGHALVETGGANVIVSCGHAGRELAIGARDEGLELASVVVCSDARSACEVLANRLVPGDTVLLMGVDDAVRARLALSLEKRLSRPARAA